ncbi:MAG: MFS transporter/efflux transporter protein [Treponematales bacterium]
METTWKKNTALFLTGQAVSMFGSMVVQYAIVWHITLKTQSGSMMTLFTIAGFLPMFFISPFGGVWADRFNKKYIISISDGAIAFASLIVALFLLTGFDNTGILLGCAIVRSFGQGVQTPAAGALIPQIVPAASLTKVNGFQGSIQSFTMLAAPMVSGALMTFAPLEIMFFLDVITAAAGIGILFFLVKVPEGEAAETEHKGLDYFHDLREGIRYIKSHGYVLRVIVVSAIFMFFAAPAALLTPLQVTRNFGNDGWRLAALEIAFSSGMMAGGVLIGIGGGFKNRVYSMALANALFGLESAALGLVQNFWVYTGIVTIMGVTMPLYTTPSMVLLQTTVEPAFMGRVLSVVGMVGSVMMPVGMLVFGPAADTVSINLLLIGTGVVISLLAVPMMMSKVLREAGRTAGPGEGTGERGLGG